MHPLAKLDHQYLWHPFTQMRDWLKQEPIVIAKGRGAVLTDAHGRDYLDANASIWTNLHGHGHPRINSAIQRQLKKIAHSSALGFANEPASHLGAELVRCARVNPDSRQTRGVSLNKVFFSDDGSTALEVALKLAYQFTKRTRRTRSEPRFLSLDGAYHGDTVGAVSLGHIDLFHGAYSGLLFKTDTLRAPYCYRCPFNRARPQRRDAREYRDCKWECVQLARKTFETQAKRGQPYAAFVFEPLMQGAAGMIAQPKGWLKEVTTLARSHGALLIADEVMTGFGRMGMKLPAQARRGSPSLFACGREGVTPDFLCVAKGLTGGYLPMAATLTTQKVFDAFLGEYHEFKTFFHGHSFTGNQLGAAAALASLELLNSAASVRARRTLQSTLQRELRRLWSVPQVGDIRQEGLVVGIELVRDWKTREPFDLRERAGIRVCEVMAQHGVLTRPIGNVIPLLPPYCTSPRQLQTMVSVVRDACHEVFD